MPAPVPGTGKAGNPEPPQIGEDRKHPIARRLLAYNLSPNSQPQPLRQFLSGYYCAA